MNLLAYADESYESKDEEFVIAVAGWLTDEGSLNKFCSSWKKVLDCYGVKYFHFNEYADKNHKNYKATQYDGWDQPKRERFLFDLALVACELGIPVGGCSAPRQPREKAANDISLKMHAFGLFNWSVLTAISKSKQKPFDSKIDTIEFVFDKNDDLQWMNALADTMKVFKEGGAPFGKYHYEDDDKCFPLQAADLYVYAMKQNAHRYYYRGDQNPGHARMLDFIMEKNRFDLENWTFTQKKWGTLVTLVLKHRDEWKRENPKQIYYPLLHCPMLTPPK